MTVKELSEWLRSFHNQDASVSVVVNENGMTRPEPFDPKKHTDYEQITTTTNPDYKLCVLLLGVHCD